MVFNFSKKKDLKINKRGLADRSHLVFEFPQRNNRLLRAYLPMLENCQVNESQRSNLSEHSLLGRNSSIYSYMGAKSRQFSLTFKISLLHVMDQLSKEGLKDIFKQNYFAQSDKATAKESFFLNYEWGPLASQKRSAGKFAQSALARDYYQKLARVSNPSLGAFDKTLNSIFSTIGLDSAVKDNPDFKTVDDVIDLILYWVNLVRSSSKNNSRDTTLGPPIVRLNHGTMYNNIPCVVENYNIKIIDDSGYDINTLTPKQIEISMSLSEQRTGTFSEFNPQTIDGDNNTGWEGLFDKGTMDPYNGLIGG